MRWNTGWYKDSWYADTVPDIRPNGERLGNKPEPIFGTRVVKSLENKGLIKPLNPNAKQWEKVYVLTNEEKEVKE